MCHPMFASVPMWFKKENRRVPEFTSSRVHKFGQISSEAMALMVLEHWRQIRAQSRKRSPFWDSQISAHSSQMPTHRSARRWAFTDLLLRAWKVPMQIRAHSSTILVTFLEKEAFTWCRVVRRCSQFIQASKHAWVWMFVTVMLSSLPLFCGWIPLLS